MRVVLFYVCLRPHILKDGYLCFLGGTFTALQTSRLIGVRYMGPDKESNSNIVMLSKRKVT